MYKDKGVFIMRRFLKRYMLLVIVVLALCISILAEAFVFSDYYWGMPKNMALDILKEKDRIILSRSEGKIVYKDNLMDKACQVSLIFSPDEKVSGVTIKWKGSFVGPKVKDILEKKYGKPTTANSYMKKYSWGSPAGFSELHLNYSSIYTTLEYTGPNQFKTKKGEDESQQLRKEMQEF
jgi:hypothetical protein